MKLTLLICAASSTPEMPPMKALTENAVSFAQRTLVPVEAVPRSEKATDFHDAPHRLLCRK